MNKRKLVQIIVKDLEEIKILAEEVASNQNDAALIIDLALNKARLLCQEIELLRDSTDQEEPIQEENEIDEEEDEVLDVNLPEPEFEIMNFEEREFPETEEDFPEAEAEEDEPDDLDDDISEDDDEEENEEDANEEDDLEEEINEEDQNEFSEVTPEEEENEEAEAEEENLLIVSDEDETEEEIEEEEEVEEEIQPDSSQPVAGINTDYQPKVREIHLDDLDDDPEPVRFAPLSDSSDRPVMHEIPKPENQVQEKMLVGETFQKERSLNDVIGEKKPAESTLTQGPVTNLRAAIGLNDRFLFIREIFDNKTEKYNTVIDKLDQLETIQQAVEYLKANLTLQKNDTSMKFVELLKRRFSK
jgi:hypothetical protein